jgi:hypothetical protein
MKTATTGQALAMIARGLLRTRWISRQKRTRADRTTFHWELVFNIDRQPQTVVVLINAATKKPKRFASAERAREHANHLGFSAQGTAPQRRRTKLTKGEITPEEAQHKLQAGALMYYIIKRDERVFLLRFNQGTHTRNHQTLVWPDTLTAMRFVTPFEAYQMALKIGFPPLQPQLLQLLRDGKGFTWESRMQDDNED